MNPTTLGIAAALGYVLFSAFRDVTGFVLIKTLASIGALMLVAFTCTSVLANARYLIAKSGSKLPYSAETRKDLLFLNITTTLSWLGAFKALEQLVPAAMDTIAVGLIPIATVTLNRLFRGKPITQSDCIGAAIVIIGVLLVSKHETQRDTNQHSTLILFGMAWSVLAAFAGAANNILQRRIYDKGVSANNLFPARFWLLILVSALMVLVGEISGFPTNTFDWVLMISIGLLGVALPVYLLQISIQLIGPRIAGFLIALLPVAALAGQMMFLPKTEGSDWTWTLIFGVLLVAVGIVYALSANVIVEWVKWCRQILRKRLECWSRSG